MLHFSGFDISCEILIVRCYFLIEDSFQRYQIFYEFIYVFC